MDFRSILPITAVLAAFAASAGAQTAPVAPPVAPAAPAAATTATAKVSPDGVSWTNGAWMKGDHYATGSQITAHKKWMRENNVPIPAQ